MIAFTTALNELATVSNDLMINLRNAALHAALGIPALKNAVASQTEEIEISYRHNYAGPGHGALRAGDHLPPVPDESVQQQIRLATGPAQTGPVILTVSPERVLISPGPDAVPAPDTEVGDPAGSAAARYDLKHGGKLVVRPDGYIGQVTDLSDDCSAYFAQLAR